MVNPLNKFLKIKNMLKNVKNLEKGSILNIADSFNF